MKHMTNVRRNFSITYNQNRSVTSDGEKHKHLTAVKLKLIIYLSGLHAPTLIQTED